MKLSKTIITLSAVFFILTAVKIFSQTPVNQFSVKFENSTTATMVGQNGLVMRTEDGGLNWSMQDPGITNVLFSNDSYTYTDKRGTTNVVQFACGENGVILKSDNSGLNWSILNAGTTENLNYVTIRNESEVYVCGNNGTLLVSYDLGETWSPILTGTEENLRMIALMSDNPYSNKRIPVIVGENGLILVSMDLGTTWTPAVSDVTTNLNAVIFADGQVVVAAGDEGQIIKSIDGGLTWVRMNSGTTLNIYSLKYVSNENKQDIVASAENGLVLMSSDLGDNWTSIQTPTTNDLFSVSFGTSDFGITTGENGTELYTIDGGMTWVESLANNSLSTVKKEKIELSQNYPNPFNPSTVISYAINDNASVNIKIYDMTGREVRTLVNSFQNAGTYSVNFNASNLASGIYFYVLRVNTGVNEITKTMRMILTK